MKIVKFQFNMFGENCYVVYDPESREAMVVDPGMLTSAENEAIDGFIARERLSVKYLVNTHLHLDHCFGNAHISERYAVTARAHSADAPLGRDIAAQARMFGIFDANVGNVDKIIPLNEGDVLTLGREHIRVIHTPGHSPGGISLYAPDDGWILTGDTLFGDGNIGRTDLPGGNHRQLLDSVRTKLLPLPPSTRLLPGHGPASTLAAALG